MSQVSIIDITGNHPEIPTRFDANIGFAIPIANTLEIFGDVAPAGTLPVHTEGSGNNITTYVQISQSTAVSDPTLIGLAAFDSNDFTVDANGFVSLAGGGGGIEEIEGDVGSITGSIVTIYANQAGNQAGASVAFLNAGTISRLQVTDANLNTFIGQGAGALGLTSTQLNVGLGRAVLASITDATTGGNVAIGDAVLASLNAGDGNNTGIGTGALLTLVDGSFNVAVGHNAGGNYSGTESTNVVIGTPGVVGDNFTVRVGNSEAIGGHTRFFGAGVYDPAILNGPTVPVLVTDEDQIMGGSFTSGLTAAQVYVSPLIDLKATGDTIIFTASALADFLITTVILYATNITGTVGAPVANLGWTAAAYDDFSTGFSTFASSSNTYESSISGTTFTQSPVVPAAQAFRINVTSADATATNNFQHVLVQGIYLST